MEEFSGLLNYAKSVAKEVDKVIAEILTGEPKELYHASAHLIKAGGKRLRPLATVLAGRMYGLPEELGIRAGASVELLHNFTLVHDDIMDKDTMRRGVPTVHVVYGVDSAILAGDLLFAKAFEALGRLEGDVVPELLLKAMKELDWAAVTVAEGQAMDMDFEKREDVTVEEYIDMIFKKTAALFKSSLVIGATLAGAADEEIQKLSKYAGCIGIAFQIRDDILGLVGDEKVLGKPVYSDLREGKKTILVIYALSRLDDPGKDRLLKALGNREASKEELAAAAELIKSTGAVEYADELAERYIEDGLGALEATQVIDEDAKKLLRDLAKYITQRKY
ncbi:MAG: polyprenyl synthetase family protein [Thermoprotei archaeon]|nr:MAG: polyprenyl synthetase family protein [Thermoprotei archaeon]